MTQIEALKEIAKKEQAARLTTGENPLMDCDCPNGEWPSLVDMAKEEVLEKLRAIKARYSYLETLKDIWAVIQ